MPTMGSSTWTQSDLPWILPFLSAVTPFIWVQRLGPVGEGYQELATPVSC